ncbi:MAG: DUF3737 family protein, partial [Clostridia bacterium]|nr:DUF3737 family protein [Clostridia bacterium]
MKKIIENVKLDEERALYGSRGILLRNVSFDGPADGESAVKECEDVEAEGCFCNLRYPFWHVHGLKIADTEMTELCRAALWYSDRIRISDCKMHGIKALRECADAELERCDIISPEFGWSVDGIKMTDCTAVSEYFMMRSKNINFKRVNFKGKYSFQYIENALFEDCTFDTKDAFWHGENITVKNSVIKGEYFAWYSRNLTLIDCTIIGTQPFCYCTGLKLIDCKTEGCDLAFEKSEVEAELTNKIDSIKN